MISSGVDFAASGKQTGFLRVSHSVHRSAYGWVSVSGAVIASGDGPTVLILAGVYGDEYEGQIALTKLVQELSPGDIQGRIIVLAAANAPAAEAGLRTSPVDQGNMNRAFPGDPRGSVTEMIARCIEFELMPEADYMVDLHSVGVLPGYEPNQPRGTRELYTQGSVFALEAGLLEPFKDIADPVSGGEIVGQIQYPDAPWKSPEQVVSPYTGIVLCKRAFGQVRRGDAAYQIAADAE